MLRNWIEKKPDTSKHTHTPSTNLTDELFSVRLIASLTGSKQVGQNSRWKSVEKVRAHTGRSSGGLSLHCNVSPQFNGWWHSGQELFCVYFLCSFVSENRGVISTCGHVDCTHHFRLKYTNFERKWMQRELFSWLNRHNIAVQLSQCCWHTK